METKNKYAKRSKISETRIRDVVRYFAADLTALQAADLSGLNRNIVNRLVLRERILHACEVQRPLFGIVEESFFGARRVKGRTMAPKTGGANAVGEEMTSV